jgi:N-acyl-D-aspartate/D-glutamate deacylase
MRGDAWLDERTVIGASDAGAHLDMLDTFAFSTVVLGEGVRERGLLTLSQAIRQLSEVPARYLGMKDRGLLRPGYWADVVVFDPDTVGRGPVYTRFDLPAGAARLYADSLGINHVIVNGREIIRNGKFMGVFPGKILRPGTDTQSVPLPGASADVLAQTNV